jgi:hypothetical protein
MGLARGPGQLSFDHMDSSRGRFHGPAARCFRAGAIAYRLQAQQLHIFRSAIEYLCVLFKFPNAMLAPAMECPVPSAS